MEADAKNLAEPTLNFDPAKNYSLPELIDLAESHNPETRVAWEHARAQAAAWGIARSELYPTVAAAALAGVDREQSYLANRFFRQTIGDFQVVLNLNYTIFDFGARAGRISAAKAEALAANFAFNDTHREVIYRVQQAYYQLLNASGQEEAARANLSNAQAVQQAADSFSKLFGTDPGVKAAALHAAQGMNTYLNARKQVLDNASNSTILTVEYNYTRQLTTNNQNITATQPNQLLPNLSNINVVLEKGMQGGSAPEFTFNGGVTFFNSTSMTAPKRGTVRDYRVSTELDLPLKEIANIGRPVLSFSGQFLALLEEPLGQKVMLNGVTIDRRGNMGIFQTKLSIPVKDSGIKIPISFTYASRTELVKEKDVRGNIGITFDLDTLFSKTK